MTERTFAVRLPRAYVPDAVNTGSSKRILRLVGTPEFRGLVATVAALVISCGGGGHSSTPLPAITIIDLAQPWAVVAPAEAGLDEVQLGRAASDAATLPRFRSLLVARHGKLVSETYFGGTDRSTLFDARSVTKSVVSLLMGIALQTQKLPSIDATVGDYLGAPYVLDDMDRAVTLRQLLTMTSRYQWDDTIDYNGEDLKFALRALTRERGVDVLYDPVGGAYAEPALRAMAWDGRYLVIGFAAGEIPKIPLNLVLLKSCDMRGVAWGAWTERDLAGHRANTAQLLAWEAQGKLRTHVHAIYPLANAAEALKAIARREVKGKVILRV